MKFKPLYNPTKLQCQLTIGNWAPVKGIQKLIGFGRGLGFHRVDYFPYWHISNSIVLGYNRSENEDTVRLWAYGYVKGEHFQMQLGEHHIKAELDIELLWQSKGIKSIVYYGGFKYLLNWAYGPITNNTLPIGVLLRPYAEIDGPENKRTPFEVDIKNLKVNGKLIKI